ncbi:MAG: type II toxin-antitoxin system RelE/ParE family toxin [Ignavibacteriales bacterium]|nr:type II toxin-antitoxin system RelE/ParE family toxin [Ignavibacteriales bacterium]
MKYIVKISPTALKDYNQINDPFHSTIKNKIDKLSIKGLELNNIKMLKGEFKGLYRLRVGDYRIIFDVENNIITILAILHRKSAYN